MKEEHPINKFKEEQKKLATKIRKEHNPYDSYQFRHRHIAYCELRGRERTQIEIPREDNKPNEKLIDSIKNKLESLLKKWNEEK